MIYLLHGDNLVASREFLKTLTDSAKNRKQSVIRLNGIQTRSEDFIQALDSQYLFGPDNLVIVEQLFSRPRSAEQKQILQFLRKYEGSVEVVFWEKKEVGKVLQRNLPKRTVIKLFKTPATIFKFLDSLAPVSKKEALGLLIHLNKNETPDLVFYMLARQIRLLLLVSSGGEVKGPPWMIAKLKRQAANFSLNQLLTTYQQLFRIDEQVKRGLTIMPLSWHLEMLLAENL